MGGNRPKNHTPAKYVTVIDRTRGLIYYYALDQYGSLIHVNGQPKLEYTFKFMTANTTKQERPPETTKDEPLEMSLFQDDDTQQEPSQQEREFVGFHFYDEFKFDDAFSNYDEMWAAM